MNERTQPNPWRRSPQNNFELKAAFPSELQNDVLAALSALPENPYPWTVFSVRVSGEILSIPYRIYHNASLVNFDRLSNPQKQVLHCLLTRHSDGFVRERHLTRIIASNVAWAPPFVVQLLGEYVVEVIRVIENNLAVLDKSLYGRFLKANPDFWVLTQRRIVSYWDCYYRSHQKDTYSAFRVLEFFRHLTDNDAR